MNNMVLPFDIPVFLNDLINSPKYDPETQVPYKPIYTFPTTIKISKINIEFLIGFLDKTFGEFEKVEVEKKDHFVYNMEYFPVDGLKICPNDEIFQKMRFIQVGIVSKARKKFPHNANCDDNFDDDDIYDMIKNFGNILLDDWFKAEVRLYYDKVSNCYQLEFNRLTGNSGSFYKFFNIIKKAINVNNLLWIARKNYIEFFETISVINEYDHIVKYLSDENICKEICSTMSFL